MKFFASVLIARLFKTLMIGASLELGGWFLERKSPLRFLCFLLCHFLNKEFGTAPSAIPNPFIF
jgi:hypothetical protein